MPSEPAIAAGVAVPVALLGGLAPEAAISVAVPVGLLGSSSGSTVFRALQVIGSGLASIGIAVTVYVIGKKNYIVFFLLAYFIAVVLRDMGITMVTYAIVGLLIALVFALSKTEAAERVASAFGGASGTNDDDEDDY